MNSKSDRQQEFGPWIFKVPCLCGCDYPLNQRPRKMTTNQSSSLEQHPEPSRDEAGAGQERLQ